MHQGDPLSPYLFILCLEQLSIPLEEAVWDKKKIHLMTFRGQIKILHLFFDDDIYFFSLRQRLWSAKILKLFYKIFVLAQAKSLVHKNHAFGFHQIQPGILKN